MARTKQTAKKSYSTFHPNAHGRLRRGRIPRSPYEFVDDGRSYAYLEQAQLAANLSTGLQYAPSLPPAAAVPAQPSSSAAAQPSSSAAAHAQPLFAAERLQQLQAAPFSEYAARTAAAVQADAKAAEALRAQREATDDAAKQAALAQQQQALEDAALMHLPGLEQHAAQFGLRMPRNHATLIRGDGHCGWDSLAYCLATPAQRAAWPQERALLSQHVRTRVATFMRENPNFLVNGLPLQDMAPVGRSWPELYLRITQRNLFEYNPAFTMEWMDEVMLQAAAAVFSVDIVVFNESCGVTVVYASGNANQPARRQWALMNRHLLHFVPLLTNVPEAEDAEQMDLEADSEPAPSAGSGAQPGASAAPAADASTAAFAASPHVAPQVAACAEASPAPAAAATPYSRFAQVVVLVASVLDFLPMHEVVAAQTVSKAWRYGVTHGLANCLQVTSLLNHPALSLSSRAFFEHAGLGIVFQEYTPQSFHYVDLRSTNYRLARMMDAPVAPAVKRVGEAHVLVAWEQLAELSSALERSTPQLQQIKLAFATPVDLTEQTLPQLRFPPSLRELTVQLGDYTLVFIGSPRVMQHQEADEQAALLQDALIAAVAQLRELRSFTLEVGAGASLQVKTYVWQLSFAPLADLPHLHTLSLDLPNRPRPRLDNDDVEYYPELVRSVRHLPHLQQLVQQGRHRGLLSTPSMLADVLAVPVADSAPEAPSPDASGATQPPPQRPFPAGLEVLSGCSINDVVGPLLAACTGATLRTLRASVVGQSFEWLLPANMPRLTHLSLAGMWWISDEHSSRKGMECPDGSSFRVAVVHVLRQLPQLESLEVLCSVSPEPTDFTASPDPAADARGWQECSCVRCASAAAGEILPAHGHGEVDERAHPNMLSARDMGQIVARMPALTHLRVRGLATPFRNGLAFLSQAAGTLRSLELDRLHLRCPPDDVTHITQLKSLTTLVWRVQLAYALDEAMLKRQRTQDAMRTRLLEELPGLHLTLLFLTQDEDDSLCEEQHWLL